MVAVEANVLGCIRPLFLGPEEELPHPSACCAEEVLKGRRSYRIELPHTERPSLAREDPAD